MQRYSYQREVIFNILKNTTSHPTADWVFAKAREQIPNISLGTVYRNLSGLCENGKVISFTTNNGESCHYDARVEPHAHFCCEGCGKVIDCFINDGIVEEQAKELLGCSITRREVILYGNCAECSSK